MTLHDEDLENRSQGKDRDSNLLIFGLILAEGGLQAVLSFLACVCSGVLQASVIYIIARDAERLYRQDLGFSDLVYFLICLLVFAAVLLVSLQFTAKTGNLCSRHLALRLASHIREATPLILEKLGPDPLLTAITRDLTAITGALSIAFNAVQTATVILVSLLLILGTSPVSGLVILCGGWVMLSFYRRSQRALARASAASSDIEGQMTGLLDHALTGFRELSINKPKRDDLFDNFLLEAVRSLRTFRQVRARCFTGQMRTAHGSWFVFMGSTAFLAPAFGLPAGITTAVVILSFLRTPIVDLTSYLPALTSARIAVRRFYELEVLLEDRRETGGGAPEEAASRKQPFQSLELQNCCFHYHDADGHPLFTVGPLNLTIRAGDSVIVTGGNGSGKTTFLKMLTGLYPLASGRVLLDGQVVEPRMIRSLFSTVFTDFWLGESLYGLDPDIAATGNSQLRILGLGHKVMIRDGRFSTIALSSGQRRRLALVAALLEDRPVILLDEWTADQDPVWRRFFHEELLPELKANGKTVIAVTHDRKPFAGADLKLSLSDGKMTVNSARQDQPPAGR